MTLPTTDAELIAAIRNAGELLRVKASLYSARAADLDVRDYLDEFARGLDDCMADSLIPAQTALERNERLRDTDPKGRREFATVESEA